MSKSSDIFEVPVSLNSRSVTELYSRRASLFKYQVVSLNSLQEIDSSGLALLVKWAKCQSSGRLRLINVPEAALRLIKTYKLTSLFELDEV